MSEDNLKPRPANIPFGTSSTNKEELYTAPVLENAFYSQWSKPTIYRAYQSENGDTIFDTSSHSWFVLPKGGSEAYQISANLSMGGGKITVGLATDLFSQHRGAIITDLKTDIAKYNNTDVAILSDTEKDELLKTCLSGKITFIGLPSVREVKQAFQAPDGNHIVISEDKFIPASEKIFLGTNPKKLEELSKPDITYNGSSKVLSYSTHEGLLAIKNPRMNGEEITWTPAYSDTPITLNKVDVANVPKQIGYDPRIHGAQTWDAYVKENPLVGLEKKVTDLHGDITSGNFKEIVKAGKLIGADIIPVNNPGKDNDALLLVKHNKDGDKTIKLSVVFSDDAIGKDSGKTK